MRNDRVFEGDLIETEDSSIFDVKGFMHPPGKAVAFPRFILCPTGNRKRVNRKYKKIYSLSDRFEFLAKNSPQYLVYDPVFDETLCEIPIKDIRTLYKPSWKLRELLNVRNPDGLERSALALAKLLSEEAKIGLQMIGISGSILSGLHTDTSDIDLIVYGSESCMKAHRALKKLLLEDNSSLLPYDCKDLKILFDFRSRDTLTSFEDFLQTEKRKVMQGKFQSLDYYVRFVRNWSEIREKYGDVHYSNFGYAKLEATIADDSEANFTPCTYKIKNVCLLEGSASEQIEEIVSFRGRFCEQARSGEAVIAQGKVERVASVKSSREHFRLLLGGRSSDYMVLRSDN